ncbi:rhodanese-like domain-containing protein [Rudanella paleaurantiibacter]|uniref:Rhodanese-like domain-containing protein n=2 Tax=Rudanella paleaurantiibacter TaxID=2614655 RepID=A0A7J5U2C2_9BACT|nr:rhodanese-like domain-containing protein [Rudanella paleaurantiibacter]KAB7731927.1 rhodanese-like domain-containing protein [Rudanella paleaurantiibacter]
MKLGFLTFLSCCLFSSAMAQPASQAYRALLHTLYGNSTVPTVTVTELKTMKDVVLLDTREKKEYDVSHLPNARWVGYDDFSFERLKGIPKTANIVTYCSVGYRSDKIGDKLKAAGYERVHNLYGSLFEWVNQGNPVVDNTGKPTKLVHAFSRPWGVWLKRGEKVY